MSGFSGAPSLLTPALGALGSLPVLALADEAGLNSESVLGQWAIVSQTTPPGYSSALTQLQSGNVSGAISSALSTLQGSASVITFDSAVSISYEQEYSICYYPVEGGSFQSYNKVVRPYALKMTIALSGLMNANNIISAAESGSIGGAFSALTGTSARTKFLNQIQTALESLSLVNVVTPEMTYKNLNLVHQDYDRSAAQGAKLLKVDLWFEQVLVSASTTFSNVASATSANPSSTGSVNTSAPTVGQAQTVATDGAQ